MTSGCLSVIINMEITDFISLKFQERRAEMERTFEEYRKIFADFYESVKLSHEKSTKPHRGHGIDHDVTVAQIAMQIAPDNRTSEKAWCAGMLHSVDRMVEQENVEKSTRNLLSNLLLEHFNLSEVEEICQAAIRHGELNQDNQSIVQQVLMDADRLANLMPAVIIRAGQSMSELPVFEFEYLVGERNPETTYYKPQSVLDDLRNNIKEYVPQLRILKAKKLAERYVVILEEYIKSLEESYGQLGLVGISL